jgi:hypothetical protein
MKPLAVYDLLFEGVRNPADLFLGLHANNVGYRNANTAAGRSFDIAFENIANYAGSVKTKTMGS